MAPPPPSPEPSDGQEQPDPAPRPPESLGEASVRQPSTPATGPLDVLLVEDDPVARTYLTEILRSRGHNVESLEEGGGAVEAFVRARHPMVILDRALPDTTGVEICRRIREDPDAEDTFVLFVTAAETQDALDEALQAGADDYVVKPVSPDLLHTRIGIAERRIREIREHRRIQAELRKASYRDQLTGLGNRTMLRDRIEKSAGRARRDPDHVFAVLLVDLDGFHGINERHGREVSDEVLREVGSRIAGSVRDLDTPVRIAADEFGVHLSDVKNESDPTRVAGRIQESLASPIEIDGRRVHVSGCIGIALGSAESSGGTEATLRSARKALTRAKSRGRGEVQIFDPEVHARAMARVELEREIRQGLENEELALHYQPILDLSTGRMHAVEALLRWRGPDDELTLPSDFIPVAEESGLIVPLGWWTLETACRQGRAWRDAPSPGDPIRISVNVSTRQFVQPDVDEIVARTLERTGLPADALHLELTETSVMANGEDAVQTLQRLKELGVRLHVDDFGTGYSSLSYLCRLPIDSLKVDRTFIEAMTDSRENREVVRTIVQLAGNLGMTVIAEGVETPEQEELLREMGCDYVQGYLYHRPMADEAIERLLTEGG